MVWPAALGGEMPDPRLLVASHAGPTPHGGIAYLAVAVTIPPQELPQDLTLKQAQSASCQPLVADMVTLLGRLKGLSHLEDAGPQQVSREQGDGQGMRRWGWVGSRSVGQGSPDGELLEHLMCTLCPALPCPALQDAALAWFAANFMQQKHPLVEAMQQQVGCDGAHCGCPTTKSAKASFPLLLPHGFSTTVEISCLHCLQGAVGVGEPEPLVPYGYERHGWLYAVQVGNGVMAGASLSCLRQRLFVQPRMAACIHQTASALCFVPGSADRAAPRRTRQQP